MMRPLWPHEQAALDAMTADERALAIRYLDAHPDAPFDLAEALIETRRRYAHINQQPRREK